MLAADVNVLTRQPRVAVLTLGCKVNHAESDELVDQFTAAGFVPTAFEEDADVYVVNTCSVTHVGDAKSRQAIRQATRRNPSALVVATGCFATTAAHRFPIEDVLVVKNRDKDRLIDIVRTHLGVGDDHPIPFKAVELGLAPAQARHTRAMIKVQDGCDSACSYCIIPRARGRSRSTPLDHCIERTRTLVAAGHKEVVITGVDLGSYGLDLPEPTDLAHLITRMLNETDIHRIRIS